MSRGGFKPRATVVLPMDVLGSPGVVDSDDLAHAGLTLEVLHADDVPGRWNTDHSSWPKATRPVVVKPEIHLALRINHGGVRLRFLDADGAALPPRARMTGPIDGRFVFYWVADAVISHAAALKIGVLEDE